MDDVGRTVMTTTKHAPGDREGPMKPGPYDEFRGRLGIGQHILIHDRCGDRLKLDTVTWINFKFPGQFRKNPAYPTVTLHREDLFVKGHAHHRSLLTTRVPTMLK